VSLRPWLRVAFVVGILLIAPQLRGESPWKNIKGPKKLGIGAALYGQTQHYQIKSLELGIGGIDPETLRDLPVENDTFNTHIRFDYWVLPFLNVFGLVGKIDSATNVDLEGFDIGLPEGLNTLSINNDGTVYGVGAVLAVGGKRWFGALAYDYTTTDTEVTTSTIKAQILSPKIGLHFEGGAVYVGAMLQDVEETHEGVYRLPFLGDVPYKVTLEAREPWNYTIGGTAGLSKHFVLNLQGSFGDRRSALIILQYRMF
jgi:hypothetical protein